MLILKKKLFMIVLVLISIPGCSKKTKKVADNTVVETIADSVYVCKNTSNSGEEKEYTLITNSDSKIKSVLYSAYVKVENDSDVDTYCKMYKEEKNNYNENYVYGDVNCDKTGLIVTAKYEWTINGNTTKRYPEYIKKHVNSNGDIDINGMKNEFTTLGYECSRR